jgi:hypothetical protein
MKNYGFFFLIFLLSCANNVKVESPIIPKDAMIAIMADLAISDAMVENEMLPNNKLIYQKKLSYYESIFKKHQYTSDDFYQSYKIYSQDLQAFSLMYDEVTEEINKIELK